MENGPSASHVITPTAPAIQDWLVAQLSALLAVQPEEIDVREPFASYGLGSTELVTLSGELEGWLGRKLSPALAYEYPTIATLSRYLAGDFDAEAAASRDQAVTTEPIAIIGIGCRFPGAHGPEAFWQLLRTGVDAITEVPPERFDLNAVYDPDPTTPGTINTRWGGFLEQVDQFDCHFFGISPREAARMDPQQRLLLETAWEALEDAGQTLERLAGTSTGVFIGIATNDYGRIQLGDPALIDAYAGTGNALSIAANRLSYVFDFRGPSLAVDTACSSSLVAVHLACQSLRNGESTLALAGGVNLILSPDITINFTKAGALAPDGRCKTFDARANGFVRSEGVGIVVLKPLTHALADGDPIYAVIRGSAVNQDGRSNGLMAPNPLAQEAVLREAYRRAGVSPGQVQYVEAHGTGTFLGDPIEARALGTVLATERPDGDRCAIGSVKTNIGHLEAAAGVAGLIKVALALKQRQLPPSLHFQEPNPHIPFDRLPLRVQTELEPWPERGGPALAGVSSFGFGGTNAHVVLQEVSLAGREAEQQEESIGNNGQRVVNPAQSSWLLPLSARSPGALQALARAYQEVLVNQQVTPSLQNLCFTASVRRSQHDHRLAIAGSSREELSEGLAAFLRSEARPGLSSGRAVVSRRRKLVFVFPGQGSQWYGMGRRLLAQEPIFREALEQCDQVMRAHADWSVLQVLTSGEVSTSRLNEVDVIQPTLFAIQVALAALWRSWSVEPDAVIGHSMGEVAAAYVAGALSLEDAARVICRRSHLAKRTSGQGAMAVVDLSFARAQQVLTGYEDRVSIAASNSPTSTVLSGDPVALQAIMEHLQGQDVFCRSVNVDFASHSPQMDSLRADLLHALEGLRPCSASLPIYSTVTGTVSDGSTCDATYWARNLREPVLFSTTVQRLLKDGYDIFLEISPHPILLGAIQQGLRHAEREGSTLPSLRREEDERLVMLGSLGALYMLGYPVDWRPLYPAESRCVPLPSYPWQRERCWLDTTSPTSNVRRVPSSLHHLPAVGDRDREKEAQVQELLNDWCYELQWHLQDDRQEPPPSHTNAGTWLIFADQSGVGEDFAALAKAAGEESVLVWPGETYACLDSGHYCLRPGQREDVQQLLTTVLGPDRPPCRGMIHLWSLDAPPAETTTASALETAQVLGCGTALSLVQVLGHEEAADSPRLWLITQGAQAVEQTSGALAVAQSPLWGLGRVIAQEHPTLWGGLVDLAPEDSPQESAVHLWAALSRADGEDQQAFRHGQRYVARLVRARPSTAQRPAFRWRPDGTYLITGGLGDLGLLVARWMVEQGARRLILLGRTQLPPRASWREVESGSRLAQQIAAIRELEALGASIHLAAVDVADEERLKAFLDEFHAEGWPPIRGVVHAAGVLQDGLLAQLDAAALTIVLRPKVVGGWLLHRLLEDAPLDFFVLFSSASSLLGQFGQGNYAAANAFLDALAHHRRAQGQPALSINWGAWAELGLAERSGGQRLAKRLALLGIKRIAPEQGLVVLEGLFPQDSTQVAVVPVDWRQYRQLYPAGSDSPLFSQLASEEATPPLQGSQPGEKRNVFLAAEPEDRYQLLQSYLSEQVARVLGLSATRLDVQQPLGNLGLDSLMAVELRNRIITDLGVNVPMGRFLQSPSIEQAATQVLEQLITEAATPKVEPHEKRALLAPILQEKENGFRLSHPLSYNQQGVWFLSQLAPASTAYHVSFAARIGSDLDIPALHRVFQSLVDRHPSLRTTFTRHSDEPVQQVHEHLEVPFEEVDASTWSSEELKTHLVEEARRPFDLEHGPVLRVSVFTQSAREHILLLVVHHIVIDFWSLTVLLNEISVLYPAEKAGEQAALPSLGLQYTDYVRWQNAMLASPEGERLWTYWQTQLAGPLPVLNLPTDRPRPPLQTYGGAAYDFRLDDELVRRLKALARAEGATLYMVLLAAFDVLLSTYTGQEDLLVASPVVGRSRAEFEGIVGFFANPVVLRADLSGNPTFQAFLSRVRRTVLAALDHQDYPTLLLVERLRPVRDPSRSPLCQVMLVMDKPHRLAEPGAPTFGLGETGLRLNLGGLVLESFPLEARADTLDLVLVIMETARSLTATLHYNPDLFDAATITRMAGHFQTLLQGIVAHPYQPISTLSLLTAAEQHQLCVEWNSTQTSYPRDTCVQELFEAQVERTPEALALVYEETRLSYRELNQRANQLAHYLRRLGVGPDVLVGIYMERSIEMVVGLFGILKAGGAYVPLEPEYPKERVAFMLEDARVPVLLTQEHLVAALPSSMAALVCLDSEWEAIAQESEENPCREATADDLAYVIYTSGSTGKPKGVMIPHRGICNRLLWMQETYRLSERDRVLQKTPFSFDVSVWEFFWPLLTGAGLVVARPGGHRDSAYLVKLIAEQQVSTLHFVPPMLQVFLEEPGLETCDSLKRVICSGEALPFELQERFFARLSAELHNLYGPTEASVDVTFWACERESERRFVPIGRPIANTQIYILDPQLSPVPVGVPGELHIGGIGLARGYLHRPDLTAEKFIPDPFANEAGARLYKTGDLARWLPDGNIEFLGRLDHQVKIRGFRIEPGEIEAVLSQHPAVAQAMVLARDDESDHKRLVAYIVSQAEQAPTSEALRGFLKEQLPDYMVPSAFVVLDILPLTPNGKVDRQALPLPAPTRLGLEQPFVAPRTPTEKALARIWAEVLRIERVGIHDNFFALGGHSLLTTQVAFRARHAFQVELPLHCLFEAPTVVGLAQVIDGILLSGSTMTSTAMTIADLKADAILDPTIRPEIVPSEPVTEPARVFLTGATGFLGAFLLHELLQQTQADIYCLVRASTTAEGAKSLQRTLESYSFWDASLSARIIPVVGDLARPLLGLSAEQFQSLATQIDVIYHNGALVNFIYPYSALKATNVLGTQEILRLASRHHVKPVHFVSTLSVFLSSDALAGTTVREDDSLNGGARLYGGYAQSKWVAEQLVMIARSRGLPVCIYRPGLITGHSQTGVWNTNDFAFSVIRSCIQLGSVPDLGTTIDLIPVDYVSRAIIYLSRQSTALGKAFHLANPQPVWVNDLVQWLRACGYPLRQMPYEQWHAALTASDEWKQTLLPFFLPKQIPVGQFRHPKIDCHNTLSGLIESDFACPPVDVPLLQTYLSYFKHTGLLATAQGDESLDAP
jgi:amino acid adenylation domain-containing protein/thioester reductase-like protein